MGLNRNFLMGQNVDLKNIKAMMTIGGPSELSYGFKAGKYGVLSPNPLPNGVLVTDCRCHSLLTLSLLQPASIKSCTINNMTFTNKASTKVASYLKENVGKTIPVIFHF